MNRKLLIIGIMILVILTVVISAYLIIKRDGITENTEVLIKYLPETISEEEVAEAVSCVKDYFTENFKGCTLLRLESTQKSNSENAELSSRYGNEKIISFYSDYKTGRFNGELSNYTYNEWRWVVVENGNGEWEIVEYGIL
jgi:uncharacterized membrane protein